MMFAAAQHRDSEPFPKRTLKWQDNYRLAAHAAAQLASYSGTFRVPLLVF
jgi:hypothetical protein